MQQFDIKLYQSQLKENWNTFLLESNQQTFLFQREFMDYHSDRFHDFSLMIYHNNNLVALLPANKVDNKVYSHQGLTYGGLIYSGLLDVTDLSNLFQLIIGFLKEDGVLELNLKCLPEFQSENSSMVNNVLTSLNAKLFRKDKVLAIDYNEPFTIHKSKLKNYRKNQNKGFKIEETGDFSLFWNSVLKPRLKEKHNTSPVHTLQEIELLKARFPNNIKQFNIYLEDEILAGITIFDKGKIVKSQYGATTFKGERTRALEFLFLFLIYHYKDSGKAYFSMGTVREDNQLGYNPGLLRQKEELGCKVYHQNFFRLEL